MSSCMGQPGASAAHCDCGWGVFREFCSDDKLTANSCEFDKNELRKRVTDKCASKQTPEERKTAFIAACVDSNDQKKDYCTCSWEAVKAKVVAIKTADDEEKMQPVVAKLAAEKCSAKMPIAVVKQDALGGCLKAGGKEDLCKCRIDALLKAVPMKALLSNDTKAIQAAGPSLAKCDAKKP